MGRPAGWMKELTGRAPMKSPGKPSLRRDVERLFWREIAKGLSSEDAALAVGASQAAGSRWFRERGGMPTFMLDPISGQYLSFQEREEIALLKARGAGVREIARRLGRSPSTISRELRRNAATRGGKLDYRASVAQWKAELMARRPKTAKLATNAELRGYVQERLSGQVRRPNGTVVPGPATAPWKGRNKPHRQDRRWATAWSPEQISNRLRLDFPHDESMRISHEAIYQALYVQGRGALRRELTACLRSGRALRVPRARVRGRGKSFITEQILISERPAEAEDRAIPAIGRATSFSVRIGLR
jgi:transposase-like protein